MPALVAALALTLSRNAWVGACAGISLLFLIRDFRLVGLVPVAAALFVAVAPAQLADRFYSTFHLNSVGRASSTTEATCNRIATGWRCSAPACASSRTTR